GGVFTGWIFADSKGQGSANDYGRIINGGAVLYIDSESGSTYKLSFLQSFGTTAGRWVMNNYDLTYGQWHHVALVYNKSATTNDPTLYIDGVAVAMTEAVTPVGTEQNNTTQYFGNNTSGTGVRQWDGKLDEYGFYSGSLSA